MQSIKIIIAFLLFVLPIYSQEFFPLEIGNVWNYELSRWESEVKDTFSIEIVGDTLMPNGFEYYVMNKSLDPAELLSPFVRVDSLFIYFYDVTDSMDTQVYDLNAPLGEHYYIGLHATASDSPRVELSYIDTTQIFGITSRNLSFYLDWIVPFDMKFSEIFGPLGWYSAHHEPIWTNLIGCKISGISYGTVVGIENKYPKLKVYKLLQNYPNPFNPTTTIEYQILEQSKIEIKVFDSLGKVVAVLVNGAKPAGIYRTVFDGHDLGSGIYFYQMRSNNFVVTKKLLLLK